MSQFRALFVIAAATLASCKDGKAEAEQAVRTYLARLVEAYRTSDQSLVDPLVGEKQALKLLGLIGVKADAGYVLDAKLLDIQFKRIEREGDAWVVETQERWYYKDRKKSTGLQVGEDSTDAYALRYRFVRKDGKLILEDLEFIGEPSVGRKAVALPIEPRVFHGLPPSTQEGSR